MLKIYLYSLSIVIFCVLFIVARVLEIYAPYKKAGLKLKEKNLTDRIRTWVQLIFLMVCPVLNLILWVYAAFLLPTEKLEDATEEEVLKACKDAESKDIFYRIKYGDNYKDRMFL